MIKKQLLNILNSIVRFFGLKIFSLSYIYKFNKIFEQVFMALYSAKNFPRLSDGITCIIFSKDRAVQLYALL